MKVWCSPGHAVVGDLAPTSDRPAGETDILEGSKQQCLVIWNIECIQFRLHANFAAVAADSVAALVSTALRPTL